MAGEIVETFSITVTKGNLKHQVQSGRVSTDQSGEGQYDVIHEITTSEVSITSFGGIAGADQGVCIIQNTDDTNYVEVGFATTDYPIRLNAKEFHRFRLNGDKDLYLKANTASVNVRVIVYEN